MILGHAVRTHRSSATAALLAVVVCSSCGGPGESPPDPVGAIELPLSTTAPSGTTYALTRATFGLAGPENRVLESDSSERIFVVDLRPGEYRLTLRDGWEMQERAPGATARPIRAVLLHEATFGFTIVAGRTSAVALRFAVGDDVIEFGKGRARIAIEVEETGSPDGGVAGALAVPDGGAGAAMSTGDAGNEATGSGCFSGPLPEGCSLVNCRLFCF